MVENFLPLKTATALMLFSVASFACADVVRCQGEAGDVTYTDTVCASDVQSTQFILVEKPQARSVTYQPPSRMEEVRSSKWAHASIASRAEKVDTASVRSARLKMIAMDGASRHVQAPK